MDAYWISPEGKLREVVRHIDDVIAHPDVFGLNFNDIKTLYEKYGEKIGIEGRARSEILKFLMQKGWIRTRFTRNKGWYAETWAWTRKLKENLWNWVFQITNGGKDHVYYDVYLISVQEDKVIGKSKMSNILRYTAPFMESSFYKDIFAKKNISEIAESINSIKESSLSRALIANEKYDCGIISSYRIARKCGEGEAYTEKELKQRHKSLEFKLIARRYSIFKITGKYKEGDTEKLVQEAGFFVVDRKDKGKLPQDLIEMGQYFEQNTVLIIPEGSFLGENKAYLYGTNDCANNPLRVGQKHPFPIEKFGKSNFDFVTLDNGHSFYLQEIAVIPEPFPQQFFSAMIIDIFSKKNWEEIEV